jgi:GNAT superfamily N-acetyltransferase
LVVVRQHRAAGDTLRRHADYAIVVVVPTASCPADRQKALTVRWRTPDDLPAFETLFADRSPASRCWCMYWRIGPGYRELSPEDNRAALVELVNAGPSPGLIALAGDAVVGWCQVTPRDAVPAIDTMWRLRRVDHEPVWSITCLYVRTGWRRRGVTSRLVAAAVDEARRAGAPAIEAYPFDADVSPSSTGTGYASTFARLGFDVIARDVPARPIMRKVLRG